MISLINFPKIGRPSGRRVIICRECGQRSKLDALGLCRNCYARKEYHRNKNKRPVIVCSFCSQRKLHFAKSMCKACYNRMWRNDGVPTERRTRQRKIDHCTDCGELQSIHARGKCRRCYTKHHRRQNPQKYHEYRKHASSNPRRKRRLQEYKRKRRSRKAQLPATLTDEEWKLILGHYNHSCAYCGGKSEKLHKEHWIPLSRGGGYTASNIVPACPHCNFRKGQMTGEEFLELLEFARTASI